MVDFTKKDVFSQFGDDAKIKIFEKIDKEKHCRIFIDDFRVFLQG